jgi:hypothetical protein
MFGGLYMPRFPRFWITLIRSDKQRQFNFPQTLARLAQSVERETLNLKAAGSTPALGSIPDAFRSMEY